MPRSKWSPEFRATVSQEYLDGLGSTNTLAEKYHVGKATIHKWVAAYRIHGIEAFSTKIGNASYTINKKCFSVRA